MVCLVSRGYEKTFYINISVYINGLFIYRLLSLLLLVLVVLVVVVVVGAAASVAVAVAVT
jgi:hypothetical protein